MVERVVLLLLRAGTELAMTIAIAMMVVAAVETTRAQTASAAVGARKINPNDGLMYRWIPPGKFRMGCLGPAAVLPTGVGVDNCLSNELPRHSVTLTKGFWLGETL